MDGLLPCPLCKGKAVLSHYADCFSAPYINIGCRECGLSLTVYVDMRDSDAINEAKAVEKWNRRADTPLYGEVGGDWHTELPTEDGWYLLKYEDDFYCANYWNGIGWKFQWCGTLLKWKKIEETD